MSRLQYQKNYSQKQKTKQSSVPHIRKLRDAGVGHGANREWEVGCKGDYDKIDDATTLKR